VVVRAHLKDLYTEKNIDSFVETIPLSELSNYNPSTFKRLVVWGSSLFPNTATLDFAGPTSTMQVNAGATATPLTGEAESPKTVLGLLTAFGLSNTDSPKLISGLKFRGSFSTSVSISYDRWEFINATGGANPLSPFAFDWWTFHAGIGPELGLESPIGYFYAQVLPSFAINWIGGNSETRDASNREQELTFVGEAGYRVFVSSRILLRFFIRNYSVSPNAWTPVLQDLTGQNISVSSASRGIAGVTLGYYIPEDRTILKKFLFF
jgi:hypothetical protein